MTLFHREGLDLLDEVWTMLTLGDVAAARAGILMDILCMRLLSWLNLVLFIASPHRMDD